MLVCWETWCVLWAHYDIPFCNVKFTDCWFWQKPFSAEQEKKWKLKVDFCRNKTSFCFVCLEASPRASPFQTFTNTNDPSSWGIQIIHKSETLGSCHNTWASTLEITDLNFHSFRMNVNVLRMLLWAKKNLPVGVSFLWCNYKKACTKFLKYPMG